MNAGSIYLLINGITIFTFTFASQSREIEKQARIQRTHVQCTFFYHSFFRLFIVCNFNERNVRVIRIPAAAFLSIISCFLFFLHSVHLCCCFGSNLLSFKCVFEDANRRSFRFCENANEALVFIEFLLYMLTTAKSVITFTFFCG